MVSFRRKTMKKECKKKKKEKKVVGYRKSCKAKGTGLSHYILVDNTKK
jgi:modified peptide precursor CbpA